MVANPSGHKSSKKCIGEMYQMTIDDKAITKRAMEESIREGVAFPYRLLIIRQHEHETAGRFKEAGECAAVRYCMELEAALRSNAAVTGG